MPAVARRLSAPVVNGVAVACGVGLLHALVALAAGPLAGQVALGGAVCTSLADVPSTPSRTWRRVAVAMLLTVLAALTTALLRPHPLALGGGIVAIAFVAMMTMAWGARAGAVSFAPILSLVFTMAQPAGTVTPAAAAGWSLLGGAAYLGWALASGALLQRRYRALALVDALRAAAGLLRARAGLLATARSDTDPEAAMRAWVQGEAELAERLQTARDFVFADPQAEGAGRDTAILLRTIDLRDVLLASRLDLDLLGHDAVAQRLLGEIAESLLRIAGQLADAAERLNDGDAASPPPASVLPALNRRDAQDPLRHVDMPPDDPRARLLPTLANRLRKLDAGTARIAALLRGDAPPAGADDGEEAPLTPAQLRRFVAPEGWPLRALAAHRSLRSPVLRHALRSGLALGAAYYIGLALPWASHPHWLVLSVAVVLRGSLEQTLARRNARVAGTLLGCAVVVALAGLHSAPLLGAIFLVSVGIAHAFVLRRYWITASAATVMALLQSHMANPEGGFAVAERVADTLLGAALAWGFSYVLPSWERRSLPAAIARALQEVGDYAGHALRLQTVDAVAQRLSRRRAYDALGALAAALQRSAAEPAAVRVPVPAVAALIDHGQRLMAHLSVVRMILVDRREQLVAAPRPVEAALAQARSQLAGVLGAAGTAPGDTAPAPAAPDTAALARLPRESPAEDVMPWLQRRLQLLLHDAAQIRRAAGEALAQERG